MKIGVQTRPWGPDKNREALPEVLAEVAAAGYDGVEIGAQHLDRPQAYRQLLAGQGLEVAGIHVGGEIHDPEAVERALAGLQRTIAFAAELGASFVPLSGRFKLDKTAQELEQQAESLNRIGELCRQSGLRLCYHNHFWEIANDCRELHSLCDHTDAALVSLCLDVGWVHRAGGDPVAVSRAFLPRVAYFHLKDTTEDEWMELGAGDVDLAALFQVIAQGTFPWVVVEQDETRRTPLESARLSRDWLSRQPAFNRRT